MCTMLAAAVGAAGTLMQGYAQYQAGRAQARVSEANAAIAEEQAHDAVARGGIEELRLRRQMAAHRGTQRAMLAASGVEADSGSGLDVQDASMREGEADAAAIRFNAARERWGHQVQAASYRNEASAARAAGRNTLFGSVIGAAGSLAGEFDWGGKGGKKASPLNGAAGRRRASSWYDQKKLGHGGYAF